MKPFDLKAALAGAKVVTRDGNEATQLHLFEAPKERDVLYGVESGYIESWDKDGKYRSGGAPSGRDLFMAPTERKEWIVRRETLALVGPFNTLKEAQRCSNTYHNSTIHEITIHE